MVFLVGGPTEVSEKDDVTRTGGKFSEYCQVFYSNLNNIYGANPKFYCTQSFAGSYAPEHID